MKKAWFVMDNQYLLKQTSVVKAFVDFPYPRGNTEVKNDRSKNHLKSNEF